MSWKLWTRERLTAADLQSYLQDQTVMQFPSASARDAVLTVATRKLGMVCACADSPGYLFVCTDAVNNQWQIVGNKAGTTVWPADAQGELARIDYAGRANLAAAEATLSAFNVSVTIPAARRIEVSLVGAAQVSDSGTTYGISILDNGTSLRRGTLLAHIANTPAPVNVIRTYTPTPAGTHAFSVSAVRLNGTGTATLVGDGVENAVQFSIRDLGAV